MKYPMSKAGLLNVLQKLNLTPGDVLVVKDHETLRFLAEVKLPIPFVVPLVFAPQGLQKLSRQDLLNLLEQLETQDRSVLPDYAISQPSSTPL